LVVFIQGTTITFLGLIQQNRVAITVPTPTAKGNSMAKSTDKVKEPKEAKPKLPRIKRAPLDIPVLSRETDLTAANLTNPEARFMVANYYLGQNMRKRADMQRRHLGDKTTPDALLRYWGDSFAHLEQTAKDALEVYVQGHKIGQWMLQHMGVGSICAAGLLSEIDITKAPTVGHINSFAGLNPQMKWEKGEKRPFNAFLKQVCFHLGEGFKKNHTKEGCFYGKIYESMKAKVVDKNNRGDNAERAKHYRTNSAEVKRTLKKGKLPDGNLDRQACNQTVKIFLSHLHAVWYWHHFGVAPPRPFSTAILGHAHEIKIPCMDMFPGFEKAYYGTTAHTTYYPPQPEVKGKKGSKVA